MALRVLRAGVGLLLGMSGALLYAASWERWGGECRWNQTDGARCDVRQDHLYDFVLPTGQWEPVGEAAQMAGASLLALALVLALLPWVLTGRRPGAYAAVALVAVVLAQAAVGVATLRSGLTGSVVEPVSGDLALYVWLFVTPALLIRFAAAAHGWTAAAAVFLLLAAPLVAAFSYALGSYDTRPWYEALSAIFLLSAGACLLVAASGRRTSAPDDTGTTAYSPAPEAAPSV